MTPKEVAFTSQLLELMQEVGKLKGKLAAAEDEVKHLRSENTAFRQQLAEFASHSVVLVKEST